MTRREARLKLREATGCSLAACLTLIPEPSGDHALIAGLAMQGLLAGGMPHQSKDKIIALSIEYADALIAALAAKDVP